jgi:hypothetical protein
VSWVPSGEEKVRGIMLHMILNLKEAYSRIGLPTGEVPAQMFNRHHPRLFRPRGRGKRIGFARLKWITGGDKMGIGLYLLIPMFIVIVVSILIVLVGGVALRLTGLDRKTANFQALSAFTRAGFTTRESELVVGHPQRRTIVTWLIILGNAGIVAVIVTGTSSLALTTDYKLGIGIAIVVAGLYIVYRLVRHAGLTRRWENLIENRLSKEGFFRKIAIEQLLRLADSHGVARVTITQESTLAGATLQDVQFPTKDFSLLGIERGERLVSSPGADRQIEEGDALVVFGKLKIIEDFFRKTASVS